MKINQHLSFTRGGLREIIFMAIIWSFLIGISLGWNIYSLKKETISIAKASAKTILDKDLVFRKWATLHGGVYVPPTEHTPPNPYLKVPDRDVVTTTGKRLTLMNPAYMLRQLQEDFPEAYGIRSHLTSLKTLNPHNAPDEWEITALNKFEKGEKEYLEIMKMEGKPVLRFMRPLIAQEGCLKCHGIQGYKAGDIRGGISSYIPLVIFQEQEYSRLRDILISHSIIWIAGFTALFLWHRRNRILAEGRQKAEEALRISESRYRSYIEVTSNIVWITSANGEVVEDIPSYRKFTGLSYKDVKGTGWSKALHPDDLEQTLKVWKKCVETNSEYNMEYRLRRYDGQYRHILAKGVPVLNMDNSVREWVGTGTDITDQKLATERLKRSEKSLNEAQRLTHLGSWDLDIVNNVLTWSDEFYRIYEINPVEFGASYEAFLDAVHPDDRNFVDKAYTDSVQNHSPYNIVHRLLMKDGRIKYIHEIGITSYSDNGQPLRSIGTGQDITDRRQAEEKIRQLNNDLEKRVSERTSELEAAVNELEAFAYSVSHDLRTPLRAIDGFSHILLEEYSKTLDAEGKRLLNVVRDNTSRMSTLIDDILRFSRTGRTEMSVLEIEMSDIIKEVLENHKETIAGKNIEINLKPLPRLKCDRALMAQAFENLIGNALKFSSKQEKPKIEIGAMVEKNKTVYYIKDNGVGFNMKYSEKLFGVFQRLHAADEFEGTGIGLAIVKRIINRHGGTIWAEGDVGKGACFYISFPRKE